MRTPETTFRPLTTFDYPDAPTLYVELVGDIPVPDGAAGKARFAEILSHAGTTVWGADLDGTVVSMATLHVIPNMTFDARPYAIVENVVTLRSQRGMGFGAGVMSAVIDAGWSADAYKIMLLTGKTLGARGFYEKLGFTDQDKYGMTLRRAPSRRPAPCA